MDSIQIILTDWAGYPFKRVKRLGDNKVKCGIGRILKNMARFDPGLNFDCTLVVNDIESQSNVSWFFKRNEQSYLQQLKKFNFLRNVYFRGNDGFDFGAYDFGLKKLYALAYEGDVVFMNSSVAGPFHDGWLLKYKKLFEKYEKTGLCGITLNSGYRDKMGFYIFAPHVQSFFFYTTTKVLRDVFPDGLCGIDEKNDKDLLILNGEVGQCRKILEAGYGICCSAFPDFFYRHGDAWTIERTDIRYNNKYEKYANRL